MKTHTITGVNIADDHIRITLTDKDGFEMHTEYQKIPKQEIIDFLESDDTVKHYKSLRIYKGTLVTFALTSLSATLPLSDFEGFCKVNTKEPKWRTQLDERT